MKVMRVFSRLSCDTGRVKCDSSSWRLCWNNDYLCSQDAWQYRWFYDPAVKEALLHVPYNNFFDFIDLAASAGVLPALQYNLICFLFLYWPIDLDWTRITEWMLRGADSSHGSLLAQAMELCTRKYGRCQWPMITEECWQEVYERFMAAKDLPV